MKKKLLILSFAISLTGCVNLLVEKKLSPEYNLCPIESRYCICFLEDGKYNTRMIGPSVEAVGKNNEHIIVKVHPVLDGVVDLSNSIYYIIPLINRVSKMMRKIIMVRIKRMSLNT